MNTVRELGRCTTGDDLDAALSAPVAPVVPDGWEPSAMDLAVALEAFNAADFDTNISRMRAAWKVLTAAHQAAATAVSLGLTEAQVVRAAKRPAAETRFRTLSDDRIQRAADKHAHLTMDGNARANFVSGAKFARTFIEGSSV